MLRTTSKSTPLVRNLLQLPQIVSKRQIPLRDIIECLHLPKIAQNQLKSPENVIHPSQIALNRLERPYNAPNQFASSQIQSESIRIASKLLSIATKLQNFIANFSKLLPIALLGHKFITIRPQTVVKLLSVVSSLSTSSPNTTQCSKSSQIALKPSQIDANHCKIPSTHRNIALNSICDIIECLKPYLRFPKSTLIITKWVPSCILRPTHSLSIALNQC